MERKEKIRTDTTEYQDKIVKQTRMRTLYANSMRFMDGVCYVSHVLWVRGRSYTRVIYFGRSGYAMSGCCDDGSYKYGDDLLNKLNQFKAEKGKG